MGNWKDYVFKQDLLDEDDIMICDSNKEINKRVTFGTVGNWLARKLSKMQIDDLKSEDKTVVGTINQKANGEGITFSINENGGLQVTFDDET